MSRSHAGYDVVVDVDDNGEGDLGRTDLQDDNLEFHSSNFTQPTNQRPSHAPKSSFTAPSSSASTGRNYLWSLTYYSQFFDVDTNEVLKRCWVSLFPRTNFLDVIDGNPDLYGPFWIATTVVVILFLTGSLSRKMRMLVGDEAGVAYDFKLLSGAAGLIYGYTGVIPFGLWAALKWSGSEAANVLECWTMYGYANLIWIPVALISWSPYDALNYVFVAIGFAISAIFLTRNLYPIISTTPHQRAKVLLIAVVALHAGLAIAIKFTFFAHNSPAARKPKSDGGEKAPEGDKPDDDTDDEGDERIKMLKMLLRI